LQRWNLPDISQVIFRLDVEIQEGELSKLLVSNEINPKAWNTMFLHACLTKRSIIHSINFGDVLAVKARAGKVIVDEELTNIKGQSFIPFSRWCTSVPQLQSAVMHIVHYVFVGQLFLFFPVPAQK
jgi:hypothetical protein